MNELDLSSTILDQNFNENDITEEVSDECPIEEVSTCQPRTESLNSKALSPMNISHQSLTTDVLRPLEDSYHIVTQEVFLNLHMNLNFLVKYSIP